MTLVEALSSYTCLEADQIIDIIKKAPFQYKMYFIKKKVAAIAKYFILQKQLKCYNMH